jgi:hypothetical protein
MQLTLVLPSLLSLPPAHLAASSALAGLAQRAPAPRHDAAGIDAVLLAVAKRPPATPLAPLAARGAGFAHCDDVIARADPVALIAGRDDVLLGGRVDDLAAADAQAFVERLNRHFAPDGLVFAAPRPDTWFVQLRGVEPPQATPLAQVTGAIHAHLPRGAQAGQWKRWLSEMQMLLHEDPRNAARERAGRVPVTAIWIADAGTAAGGGSDASTQWFAPAGREGDVARGLAAQDPAAVAAAPASLGHLPPGRDAVVILPALRTPADLDAAATGWLAPALAALDGRALAALTVVATDGRHAFVWTPRAMPWWSRWRPWARARAFEPPVAPDSQ